MRAHRRGACRVILLESETRVYKKWSDGVGVAWASCFVKCDVGGDGMTTNGGTPRCRRRVVRV